MKAVLILAVVGIISRLLSLPHGLSLTAAVILMAGAYFGFKRAVLVALGVMVISDAFKGFHQLIPWTWTGALLMAAAGALFLRRKQSLPRVAVVSSAALSVYHLWANFGVWFMGSCVPGARVYEATFAGLIGVYQQGLSYALYSLTGNVLLTLVSFIIARNILNVRATEQQSSGVSVKA